MLHQSDHLIFQSVLPLVALVEDDFFIRRGPRRPAASRLTRGRSHGTTRGRSHGTTGATYPSYSP